MARYRGRQAREQYGRRGAARTRQPGGDRYYPFAAMEQLDLIITVDTSVAHLAGAMGRPVWICLPAAPLVASAVVDELEHAATSHFGLAAPP